MGDADQRGENAKRTALRVALLALGLVMAGCFPPVAAAPEPLSASSITWGQAHWPGVTASALAEGREVFISHCDRCHGYPKLSAIGDARWPRIVKSMGKKSHLDAAQEDALLHFILAFRSDGAGHP